MLRNNRRRRQRRRAPGNALSNPLYQSVPMKTVELAPALHTLDAWVDIASGLLGVNGIAAPIQFNYFKGYGNLASFYRYVTVLSYRFHFSVSTRPDFTDAFDGGAVAFYPSNYLIESADTTVPTALSTVQSLPGSVQLMPGAINRSPWVKVQVPQTYSTADIGDSVLGIMYAYSNDLPPEENVGQAKLEVNFRFWGKRYVA